MRPYLILFASVLLPSAVWAQEGTESWPGLDASRLSTVYVTDDTGKETVGQLLRLQHDSVVILADQIEHRFEAQHVWRIQKRGDSLKNGVLIGAIVGAAVGVLAAGMQDCPTLRNSCPGTRVAMPVVAAGVYALLGAGIDALFTGRTTLYEAKTNPPSTRKRISISPFADDRVAVKVSFRW